MDIVMKVFLFREGSNPEKFIYNSDLLTKYQNNIHIVTEWIANEGLDCIANVDVVQLCSFQ